MGTYPIRKVIMKSRTFDNVSLCPRAPHLDKNDFRLTSACTFSVANHKLTWPDLRVHFEARNPLVIATNYDGYFDPETYGNIYAQPMARTYSVGLNITF